MIKKKEDLKNAIKMIKKPRSLLEIPIYLIKFILAVFIVIAGSISSIVSAVIVTCLFIFTCCVLAGGFIYVKLKPEVDRSLQVAYDKMANVKEDDFLPSLDTYVYDKDGNTIGLIHTGNFDYVDISDISMNIQDAYISQEDKRFKEHPGVDLISTIRAGIALIKNNGGITQGGSTITQQVIKNTYLTQEKTFERKFIEILMAPQLEKKFSKPKIMEFYCNTNYYGNRCYGVEAASQFYFGKHASDVNLAEAALLVGLSNSPSRYNPLKHEEAALAKRNEILDNMVKNEFITEKEAERHKAAPLDIKKKPSPKNIETYASSYAIHCAAIKLMETENFQFVYDFKNEEEYENYMKDFRELYEEKTDMLRGGGYIIKTSIDKNVQNAFQEEIDTMLSKYTEVQENGKLAMQGAAVVTDNKTGYVIAIIGGRGTTDQFNRGFLSARQPGSSIKPLLDYTPAFETGLYYPSKIVVDEPIPNGPKNSGGRYRGPLPLREAVNRSINTIAYKTLDDIGIETGLDYLEKMHFEKISYIDHRAPSVSIGGFTYGVRVVDMAKGYQTLANGGLYRTNTCIKDITDLNGKSLIPGIGESTIRVYGSDSAYMMTNILIDTIEQPYGTGRHLKLNNDIIAAGKTGTTNQSRDTWFCGYTPYYTAAVWVGYDTPRPMHGIYGATYAGRIWKNGMDKIHEGLSPLEFERPESIYESPVKPGTGEPTEHGDKIDIFSSAAEIKAAEIKEEIEQKALIERVTDSVNLYEKQYIEGPEDTLTIESDFDRINKEISKINDSKVRVDLYKRLFKKYKKLTGIRDSMKPQIEELERQKKNLEAVKQAKKEKEAEEKLKDLERQGKETEILTSIAKINAMEFKPSDTLLIDAAKNLLNNYKGYANYPNLAAQLEAAIMRINSLPTEAQYLEQKRLEEEKIKQDNLFAEQHLNEVINTEKNRIEKEKEEAKKPIGPGDPIYNVEPSIGPGYID